MDHAKVNGLKTFSYVRLYLAICPIQIQEIQSSFILSKSTETVRTTAGHDSDKIHMVCESQRIFRALNSSLLSLLSPLCPSPHHHLCPPLLASPLWVSSWWCVRGWGDDEECCCCDLEGFRVAQTVAHTQVYTHMQACATLPDVEQIALLRLCKVPYGGSAAGRLSNSANQRCEEHVVFVSILYIYVCV